MTKIMYIQPSVNVTEMKMVQTLCASGGDTGGGTPLSNFIPDATTDIQL